MATYFRPQGNETLPFYHPQESILLNFPAAVKIATYTITDQESTDAAGFRKFLCSRGATEEGLAKAVQFYENYLTCLLERKAQDDPFATFLDCGLQQDDPSLMLFQSCIGAALLGLFHEMQVARAATEIEWRDAILTDAKDYILQQKGKLNEQSQADNGDGVRVEGDAQGAAVRTEERS